MLTELLLPSPFLISLTRNSFPTHMLTLPQLFLLHNTSNSRIMRTRMETGIIFSRKGTSPIRLNNFIRSLLTQPSLRLLTPQASVREVRLVHRFVI
jgi:hypothetical protein